MAGKMADLCRFVIAVSPRRRRLWACYGRRVAEDLGRLGAMQEEKRRPVGRLVLVVSSWGLSEAIHVISG